MNGNNLNRGEGYMRNKTRLVVVLLAMLLSLAVGAAIPINTKAQSQAKIFVDPPSLEYYTYEKGAGDTIQINVSIANITGLAGIEFILEWDPTVLKGVSMEEVLFHSVTPEAEWSNIWMLKHEVADDHVWYSYTWMDMSAALAGGYAPIDVNTTTYPPEGKATVATITLEIVREPTKAEGYIDTVLTFTSHKLGDVDAQPIDHVAEDGYFKLIWGPPTIKPYFSVEPSEYKARSLGEEFSIDIKINNLAEGWEAVGFEFKLGFNSTLLEVVNVTEGPFLPPFGAAPNQGTLFMYDIREDHVLVGDVVLPDENGTWHAPFPNGEGVIATITFRAIYETKFPEVATCILDLFDTKVGDWMGNPVPQDPEVDGIYQAPIKVLGRRIDIYTQWPYPYGGQGPNAPSDMFWPQQEVILYANVTYNEWPEQNKRVSFEIRDPHGELWAILTNYTNENGVAFVKFRLPWPCDNPEYWLGEWSVIGTVDIAGEVVNDTLTFHYDYLVHIWSVTTDKAEYAHGEYINVTITYGSKRMQSMNVTIGVTALDETGVPFDKAYVIKQIGGAIYCHYNNDTFSLSLYIPKWARAGTAKLYATALSELPWNGGSAICQLPGYYSPEPTIFIKAE